MGWYASQMGALDDDVYVTPKSDIHLLLQQDTDFYHSDNVEKHQKEQSTPSWIFPAFAAVETILFAFGPGGVLLSAGLSFACAMMIPGKVSEYNSKLPKRFLFIIY